VTEGCVLPEGTSCEGTHLTSTAATPPPHQPWPKYSADTRLNQSHQSHQSQISQLGATRAAQPFLRGVEGVLGTGHSRAPRTATLRLFSCATACGACHHCTRWQPVGEIATNAQIVLHDFVTTLAFAVVAWRGEQRATASRCVSRATAPHFVHAANCELPSSRWRLLRASCVRLTVGILRWLCWCPRLGSHGRNTMHCLSHNFQTCPLLRPPASLLTQTQGCHLALHAAISNVGQHVRSSAAP
jgi:hypothetical protein